MFRLQTLGGLDLRRDDGARLASILTHPKRAALLVYLAAARPGAFQRRDTLLALFWPELDEERARASLRKAVHLLRQSLGGDVITRQGDDAIGLDPGSIRCDVVEVEAALAAGRDEEALELYPGPFLDGFFLTDAPDFEHWADATRARLQTEMFNAASRLAAREESRGNVFAAAAWARRGLELLPFDEHGLRVLLRLLHRLGDRAGALQAYDAFAVRLATEFDDEPSAETRSLLAGIRAEQDPPAPTPVLPPEPVVAVAPPAPIDAAPDIAPPTPRSRAGSRNRVLAAATAALLLIVATGGWFARTTRTAPADDDAVAVFPFAVSGGPELAHLGEGMITLLSANLNAVGEVRSVDASLLLRALSGDDAPAAPDAARRLAGRLGARFYVTGSVLELGGEIRLSATLYDRVHGAAPHDVVVQGARDDLFTLVDQLTARLIAGHVTEPALSLARVGALTTQSLPALNAYLRGEREYRAGRYHAATDLFTAAAQADTLFALAWYRLVSARRWAKVNGADAALSRAVRLSDRLPPRERQLIHAFSLLQAGRAEQSERLYRTVLATHPDDIEAWEGVGEILFHWSPMTGGSVLDARPAFERVIALEPSHAGALEHLSRIAGAAGDQERAQTLARRVVALHPLDPSLPVLAMAGRIRDDDVRDLVRRADAHTLVQTAALLAAFADDAAGAAFVAAELTATDRSNHLAAAKLRTDVARGTGHIVLALLELSGGRVRAARAELARAARLQPAAALEVEALLAVFTDVAEATSPLMLRSSVATVPMAGAGSPLTLGHPDRRPLVRPRREVLLALLDARRGDLRAAASLADTLDALQATDARRFDGEVRLIRAYVAWREGRAAAALAALGEPVAAVTLPTGASYLTLLERLLRAEIHRSLGDHEAALAWYATFPDGSGYDFAFLPLTYLRRAELLEQAGRPHDAARFHARFAAAWRNADPEFRALVERSRARAAKPGD